MNIRYRLRDFLNLPTHTVLGIDLLNWLHLLWKNRFAISIWYVPKALFITGNVLLNAPLQWFEYIRFNKKIKEAKVESPVFILGHPRSGTTYLQYVLSKDPSFAYCTTTQGLTPHIFLSAEKFAERILKAAMPETRPQDNVKAGATLPIEEEFAMGSISHTSWVHGLYFPKNIYKAFDEYVTFTKGDSEIKNHWKEHFDFFLKKLSFRYKGKRLLLKSPANTGRLKELYELYPDARFIHIHRNPMEVYLSNERLYEKILPLIGFQKVTSEFMQEHILYAYEEMYKKYLHDKSFIPDDHIVEISYESFVTSPLDAIHQIYNHLGLDGLSTALPLLAKELQGSANYKPNIYNNLDAEKQAEIKKRWVFAFEAFDYSTGV